MRMTCEAKVYQTGNSFQKLVYRKMADYLDAKGITHFSMSQGGKLYRHLLPSDCTVENFLFNQNIYDAAKNRFDEKKAGDWKRAISNTASSQPCCFNLFVPLQQDLNLASKLLTALSGNPLVVHYIEIEFTPDKLPLENLPDFRVRPDDSKESIGDQGNMQGTDADIAVFYSHGNLKGVILCEFKYIEDEFSQCTSWKNKSKDIMRCSNPDFYKHMMEEEMKIGGSLACGYLKYENWSLTIDSEYFDINEIRSLPGCPFRHSLNQLWRNFLLAEKVKNARGLDECQFWVISPKENKTLWNNHKENVVSAFRTTLSKSGNDHFKKFYLEDVCEVLNSCDLSDYQRKWMSAFTEKYLIT